MPTSALLERVEQHIERLDRTLRETENLLCALKRGDREDWIRQLQERLAAADAMPDAPDEVAWEETAQPCRRL
jgi:hypothetical protein